MSSGTETIVLPNHKVAAFMANINEHDDKPLASWKTYTVKAGERPETIAARYKISVAELNQANNIGGRRRMATGQTILVPSHGEMQPTLADVAAPLQVAARAPVRRPVGRAQVRKAVPGSRLTTRAPAKPAVAKSAVRKPITQTASR